MIFIFKNKYFYILGGSGAVIGLIVLYILNNSNNSKLIKDNNNYNNKNKIMSQQLIEIRKTITNVNKIKYPTMKGILLKKSRFLKEWRSRLFVIDGELLLYFEVDKVNGQTIGAPLGVFNLLHCSFTLVSNEKRSPMVFRIDEHNKDTGTIGKNCLISGDSLDVFNQWFQLLPQIQTTFKRKNQLVVKLQSHARGKLQCSKYKALKEAALSIQRFYHICEGQRKLARFVHNVVKVQAYARRFIAITRFKKMKNDIMVIQSYFHVGKARARLDKEFMRKRIAQELLSTEKSYVYNLKLIIDIFIRPLVNFNAIDQKVLSTSEISGVFGNWERLYKINSEFLLLIQDKLDNWHIDQKLGDIFISNTDSLFEYTPYVTNYDHSRKLLDKLTANNENFRNFLDAAQRDKRSKYLDISSFLIQPIQRLPRYELLLRDLLKSTHHSHGDWEILKKGIIKIKEITMYVNDQQKERENLSKVIQIQQDLITDNNNKISFSSATRLIREGEVRFSKKKTWNYMYLFNSQLVIIQKGEKKIVKEVIQMDNLDIRDDNNNSSNNAINSSGTDLLLLSQQQSPSSPDLNNSSSSALPIGSVGTKFKLMLISQKLELSCYFNTTEEKNNWFTDIAITLNRLEQKRDF